MPPNPLELLSRPSFDELIKHVRSSYDVVLIDTPSIASGDDAVHIAMRAGAALAVARTVHTRVHVFKDLVEGLTGAGVAVVGSVLNEIPVRTKASR